MKKNLIVVNAGNSCYIDSLLMSLFYFNSEIYNQLLKNIPKDLSMIYLQEYIDYNFVKKVRDNDSVSSDDINLIRTICFDCGWRNGNLDEYYDQQDISEFYQFIINKFCFTQIEIQKTIMTENENKDSVTEIEKIPFIPLTIPQDTNSKYLKIKDMLHDWLYNNHVFNGNKNTLHSYNLTNIPYAIPLSINRFNNQQKRNNIDIVIPYAISPFNVNNSYSNNLKYKIHSIICHSGETPNSGHYYSVLYDDVNNKWFMFNDLQYIPSLFEISMKDKKIIDDLKKNCFFLIYILK